MDGLHNLDNQFQKVKPIATFLQLTQPSETDFSGRVSHPFVVICFFGPL